MAVIIRSSGEKWVLSLQKIIEIHPSESLAHESMAVKTSPRKSDPAGTLRILSKQYELLRKILQLRYFGMWWRM
jgi:hypothetical protein